MKSIRILASIIFAAAAATASASMPLKALPDTIVNITDANSATLYETPKGVELIVNDTEKVWSLQYPESAKISSHQEFSRPISITDSSNKNNISSLSGFHFGFCFLTSQPQGWDIEAGKSFEIGIDNAISYTRKIANGNLNIGIGVNWRNYRMTGNTRFVNGEGGISVAPWQDDIDPRFSRIEVFSLGFPITWTQNFPVKMIGPSRLGIELGAILNWNSHASMRTEWINSDGTKARQTYDSVGQRKFTIDLMAAVRVAPVTGIYVKYSPMSIFKDGCGPKMSQISTGLYFFF